MERTQRGPSGFNKAKAFSIFLALMLVGSLGLHSVQVRHIHIGEGAGHHHRTNIEFVGAYMHMADKKLLAELLSVWAYFALFLVTASVWRRFFSMPTLVPVHIVGRSAQERRRELRLFPELFSSGVLHSKYH